MMPHASFCTLHTSSSLGRIRCSSSGLGRGMGEMDMQMASDTPEVLAAYMVVYSPISFMIIMASVISRASDLLWNWCGVSGEGDVGWYSGEGAHSPMRSASGLLQSSKSISSPTMLWGELRFRVGIGTLKKGGDRVCRGIGVGDSDINNKFSVLVCGDLRPKMDHVLANCILSVKEGGLALAISDDSGVVGDGVPILMGSCDNRAIVVDLGIGVGCGGKDIGEVAGRLG